MKHKKTLYLLVAVLIVGAIFLGSRLASKQTSPKPSHQPATASISTPVSPSVIMSSPTTAVKQALVPLSTIAQARTLAVDPANPSNVYIATQRGLLLLKNDTNLYRVGNNTDDVTGFSVHPTQPTVLFRSGRSTTGNTGFERSNDSGFTWNNISDGSNGPVAFTTISISPVNPNLVYGWYQGNIQKSTDEGRTWQIVSKTPFSAAALAADTKNQSRVYAASPQGLFVSNDEGKNWKRLMEGSVSLVSIDSRNNNNLYSYSDTFRLADSSNGGATWNTTNAQFNGETPVYLGYYQNGQTDIVYILTKGNSLYKSGNGGAGWTKIR